MQEYTITITQTLRKAVVVQASSKKEAADLVWDLWADDKITLNEDDLDGLAIETVESNSGTDPDYIA